MVLGELDNYFSLMHIVLFNSWADFQLVKYYDLYETNPRTNDHHGKSQAQDVVQDNFSFFIFMAVKSSS